MLKGKEEESIFFDWLVWFIVKHGITFSINPKQNQQINEKTWLRKICMWLTNDFYHQNKPHWQMKSSRESSQQERMYPSCWNIQNSVPCLKARSLVVKQGMTGILPRPLTGTEVHTPLLLTYGAPVLWIMPKKSKLFPLFENRWLLNSPRHYMSW